MSSSRIGRTRVMVAALVVVVTFGSTALTAGAQTPVRCFTDAVHRAILDRAPTAAELTAWEQRLAAGTPKTVLLDEMARSDEAWTRQFDLLYRHALGRGLDAGGRSFWLARIRSGTSWVGVSASVYGSSEFHRRAGGTDAAYVAALYQHVLGRSGDARGIGHWLPLVPALGRAGVAAQFLHTREAREVRLEAVVQRVLGRTSTTDYESAPYWVEQLRTMSDLRLAVNLAAGTEFQTRAELVCSN